MAQSASELANDPDYQRWCRSIGRTDYNNIELLAAYYGSYR